MNEPAVPATSGSPRIQQALLALQSSRLALRAELIPLPSPAPRSRSPQALARLWWRRLRAWPTAHLARQAVRQWWQQQPWQPLGDALIGETRQQLWPLLRRHPWASVGAAAAAGAALVALRPWRWHWVDRQVRRAPGAASGWLMRQLTAAPLQGVLLSLLALAVQRARPAPAPDAAEAPAGHQDTGIDARPGLQPDPSPTGSP